MKLRAFSALLLATLAYAISTIIGLIRGLPLLKIFYNSIILTSITGVLVWIIVFLLEYFAVREQKKTIKEDSNILENKITNLREKQKEIDNSAEDEAADFAPLTPPILEVAQQEPNREEGN